MEENGILKRFECNIKGIHPNKYKENSTQDNDLRFLLHKIRIPNVTVKGTYHIYWGIQGKKHSHAKNTFRGIESLSVNERDVMKKKGIHTQNFVVIYFRNRLQTREVVANEIFIYFNWFLDFGWNTNSKGIRRIHMKFNWIKEIPHFFCGIFSKSISILTVSTCSIFLLQDFQSDN